MIYRQERGDQLAAAARFTLMESRTVEVEGKERQNVRCMDRERMCALYPCEKLINEGSGFILFWISASKE